MSQRQPKTPIHHEVGIPDKVTYGNYNVTKDNKKRRKNMSEKEKKILETFEKIIPKLTDTGKEKLLSFGEGMAFMIMKSQEEAQTSSRS